MNAFHRNTVLVAAAVLAVAGVSCRPTDARAGGSAGGSTTVAAVSLLRLPSGGIQPQAAVDSRGVVHVVFFKGRPEAGDLYYYHYRLADGPDSASSPVLVNSVRASACAVGTIRTEQIAIGKDDRVHVIWNGVPPADKKGAGMFVAYTRLNDAGGAFEPQRSLAPGVKFLDGGCSVAADRDGNVYTAWHAAQPGKVEDPTGRGVFLARSSDNGGSFGAARMILPTPTGVCPCCTMRAMVDRSGVLRIVYRQAKESTQRDTVLLTSTDEGQTFASRSIEAWVLNSCPMSSFSLADAGGETAVGWETDYRVFWCRVGKDGRLLSKPIGSPGADKSKHPVVVANDNGQLLFAWTEGTAWATGGSLSWQVYDKAGRPMGQRGHADGVPAWSLLTAYARPDGSFAIVY